MLGSGIQDRSDLNGTDKTRTTRVMAGASGDTV